MLFRLYDSNRDVIGNITDVVRTMDGETIITLDPGHTFQFKSYDIYWDSAHNAYIKKNVRYHQDALDNACYTAQAQAIYNRTYEKEARAAMSTASIKNVIFAPPATIVYWSDGSKTVVKCSKNDIFDPEKGLAMAIAKHSGGNKGSYYKEIQNWVEKSGKKYPGKPAAGKTVNLDVLKKYSSEANKDLEKFLSDAKNNNQSGALLHLTALVADLKILEIETNK